jgi:small subunit ribosomal protein S19e
MVNVYDVPAEKLIAALAERLKEVPEVVAPEWSQFVKTGSHAERPPAQAGWWQVRAASLLRKAYVHGPIGLGDLARVYGGTKQIAYFPKHHRDAGGSINRNILKQLEAAGLVTKKPKGRVLTSKGTAMLDKLSMGIFEAMAKENAAIARYR